MIRNTEVNGQIGGFGLMGVKVMARLAQSPNLNFIEQICGNVKKYKKKNRETNHQLQKNYGPQCAMHGIKFI